MSGSKSVFNEDWMDKNINPDFAEWVREVPQNPFVAYCLLCKKKISLSNMGRQSLTSHANTLKHKKISADSKNSASILNFVSKESNAAEDDSSPKTAEYKKSVSNFFVKEQSFKAEILWALKLVASHSSFNAFNDIAEIFCHMFTDSDIAKKCTLGRTKMSYLICYGLAPFFQESLQKSLRNKKFVLCFDEALNRISQKCQMDLIVRYWCDSTNRVYSRYWNSVFLRRTTAQALFENSKEVISSSFDLQLLLQISMDGPSVNFKFLQHVKEELLSENDSKILDLGTCGLHIIHGALQYGHKSTGWKVDVTLRAIYRIFKDSPARRAVFIEATGSSEFPLKFCSIRWVENVNVCERALKVFDNIKKYVEYSKKTLPGSITCDNVRIACQDKLTLAKISFFAYIANILQPFLKKFQTSQPMVPFLYENIFILVKQLMKNIVKNSVIEEVKSLEKLFLIDLDDPNNLRLRKNTVIGIVTAGYLNTSGATESEKRDFLAKCFVFVKNTTKKIFERMSKNFAILKAASCLNPHLLKSNAVLCEKRMVNLLQLLYSNAQISPACSERAKVQFEIFLEKLKNEYKEQLDSFNQEIRLDDFYSNVLKPREFSDLWEVVKIILVLSHGNASVESGFSINKDMLVENLKEDSLIGLRTVYDAIKFYGGILNVPISKDLLQYAKLARVRYYEAFEKQKKIQEKEKEKESNKRKITLQIKLLQKKKMKVLTEKTADVAEIDAQIYELAKKKDF